MWMYPLVTLGCYSYSKLPWAYLSVDGYCSIFGYVVFAAMCYCVIIFSKGVRALIGAVVAIKAKLSVIIKPERRSANRGCRKARAPGPEEGSA
jgi:hypothetical protein